MEFNPFTPAGNDLKHLIILLNRIHMELSLSSTNVKSLYCFIPDLKLGWGEGVKYAESRSRHDKIKLSRAKL